MKKILPICILGLFICSGLVTIAQPIQPTTPEKIVVRFSQPTLANENALITIQLQEANSFLTEQGKPMLPCYTETFYYPFGTTIKSVMVTPTDVTQQALTSLVAPTPPMVAAGMDTERRLQAPMDYGTAPYPASWFTYETGCGIHDGALTVMVTVTVNPVIYHPAENYLDCAGAATIMIQTEPAPPRQSSSRESYQLVVIGPSSFSSQIDPLITHKISKGITAKFVSTTEIYSGTYFPVTGRDNQEKIKYFIKNAIETWSTGNILLFGGDIEVPPRDTHVFIADDPQYGNEIFTTDLYYADIYNASGGFQTWDTNNNNIFGEFNWDGQTDKVDLHPDVYLGRLPATSTSQVTTMVNKIIGYENNPGYQQSWFPNLIVIGGDSFDDTNDKNIDEGEYANQKVVDLMTGFIATKLWASNGMLTSIAPSGLANIKSAINAGCGFVDMDGHGNPNTWATHPHASFNIWIPTPWPPGGVKSNDLLTLNNGDQLPILTVEACSTSKYVDDPNCFNWAFLYNANGGGIGSFGATGIGYSYIGAGVIQGLIGKIGLDTYRAYKTDGAVSFGEMWAKAINRYIKSGMGDADYKSVEEWQPFGDPSLVIGEKSNAPLKPATPTGTASGDIKTAYTYTSSTTDPDGDKVSYMFDWGDGTTSGWLGPVNSGATITGTKTWTTAGTYQVKVVAKDTHGILSVWSDPLPVTMPTESKYAFHPFLQLLEKLLERFPNAFPLLRNLVLG